MGHKFVWLVAALILAGGVGAYVRRHQASDTTGLLRPVEDVERLLDEFDAELGGEATRVNRAALAEILDSPLAGD